MNYQRPYLPLSSNHNNGVSIVCINNHTYKDDRPQECRAHGFSNSQVGGHDYPLPLSHNVAMLRRTTSP